MDQNDRQLLHAYIDGQKDAMIETLRELLRIPSVKSKAEGSAPFGQPCADALTYMLEKAQTLGFATKNLDNYIGYAEAGSGETLFAVLSHLDVVPVGDGWSQDPFEAEIVNGEIVGRGAMDDKGPAVAALYALAAVQSLGKPYKQSVRLLFGCDEESGWQDIDHYRQHDRMPDSAISPDADYPLINAEKGILHLQLAWDFADASGGTLAIRGGSRPNVVPDEAKLSLSGIGLDEALAAAECCAQRYGASARAAESGAGVEIAFQGKPAHAMQPELGLNAIAIALECAAELPLGESDASKAIRRLHEAFPVRDSSGNALRIACQDAVSGALTANLGMIACSGESMMAVIDIRYPISTNGDMLLRLISDFFQTPATMRGGHPPHFVSEHSELVQTLLRVYEQETGASGAKCLSIGGGTYARAIENAVSFGCRFPGREDLAHQANERIAISDLVKNCKILAAAIAEICLA